MSTDESTDSADEGGAGTPAPGRRATIIDVAAAAGVSRQTVSRAVNDLPGISAATRERVLAAAEALNYRPSRFGRGLVSAGPPALGLLVDDLSNAFFPEIARAVVREAAARGWNVVLAETGGAADPTSVALDLARRADALLGYGLPVATGEDLPTRMPLVRLDAPADQPVAGVRFDDSAALGALAEHLRAVGARRLALLDVQEERTPRAARLSAALAAHGLDVTVIPGSGSGSRSGDGPGGRAGDEEQQVPRALEEGAQVILGWNDAHALAVLKRLRELDVQVPGEMRVVGIDGLSIGTLTHPELTTLGVDLAEAARDAVDLVDGIFAGRLPYDGPEASRTVAYRLIVRDSA
ncbi:LacI family DNA-binding transcriptional regulator [Brachybacterium sp. DNPG3]